MELIPLILLSFTIKKSLFFVVGGFFCLLDVRGPLDVNFCSVSRTVKESDALVSLLHSFLAASGLLLVASCEAWCFGLSVSASLYHSPLLGSLWLLLDVRGPLNVNFCSVSCTVKKSGASVALLHSLLASSGSLFVASCVSSSLYDSP